MILLTILFIIALLLGLIAIAFLSIGGVVGIILFSDVIVCVVLVVWVIKKLISRRRK